MNITANESLDAKQLACPMPIIKTKKAMTKLEAGQVIEIQATDKGSTADLRAWAESAGHQYLGTVEQEGVLLHYLRKTSDAETKGETKHDAIIKLEELRRKVEREEAISIVDVREPAEFSFGHIPGSVNIPLGEINRRFQELNKDEELHVICRTGSRSDLAAQKLSEYGFNHVKNVIPGMSEWGGSTVESAK